MSDGGKVGDEVAAETCGAPGDTPVEETAAPGQTATPSAAEPPTAEQPESTNDPPVIESRAPDHTAGPLNDEQKASVRRQVRFYFCDSNLVRDVFLKKIIAEDPEGYVSIALLMSFQRMRSALNIAADIGPDKFPEALVKEVGNELRSCDIIAVNEDGTKVRRKEPLGSVDKVRKDILERSLAISKLPTDATLEQLEAFFAEHVDFNCIWMVRRGKDKRFEGDAFLDCKNVEVAKELMEKKVEYNGTLLKMEWKAQVTSEKREAKQQRRDKNQRGRGRGRGRGRERGRGGRGRYRRDDGGAGNDMQVDPQGKSAEAVPQNGAEQPATNGEPGEKRKMEGGEGAVPEAKKAKTTAEGGEGAVPEVNKAKTIAEGGGTTDTNGQAQE